MRRRGILTVAACAMALAAVGCGNRMVTDHAVLDPADASGPQLRPGLWRIEDPGCSLRETNRVSDWPNCGRWVLVRPGDFATMTKEADGPVWTSRPYVLAGEGPQAMQVSGDPGEGDFGLYGVRVLAFGPDGRAIRIRRWTMTCGVERTTGEKDQDGRPKTAIAPWNGAVMTDNDRCRPDGVTGLLAAVRESETGAPAPDLLMHWVREGPP